MVRDTSSSAGRRRLLGRAALATVVGAGLALGGCGDNAGQGAVGGAAIGALAGLGIGSLSGDAGKGAAAGAIGGAVLGGIIGDQNRRRDDRDRYRDY